MTTGGGKGGVVFPGPAVIIRLLPVYSAAAPEDGDVPGGGRYFFIIGFAFPEKSVLIPQIADEVAGEAHFRKHQHMGSCLSGSFDFLFYLFPVLPDVSGNHIDLGGGNFYHDKASFP